MAKIKYGTGTSTGAPFEEGEVLTPEVTGEGLSVVEGFAGDSVTYTATVLDTEHSNKINAQFVASLLFGADTVISNQVFSGAVYDQATGILTLTFTVPAGFGSKTVKLSWAEQIITI